MAVCRKAHWPVVTCAGWHHGLMKSWPLHMGYWLTGISITAPFFLSRSPSCFLSFNVSDILSYLPQRASPITRKQLPLLGRYSVKMRPTKELLDSLKA